MLPEKTDTSSRHLRSSYVHERKISEAVPKQCRTDLPAAELKAA